MIPLLLVMAAGPLMAWKRAGPGAVLRRLAVSLVCRRGGGGRGRGERRRAVGRDARHGARRLGGWRAC